MTTPAALRELADRLRREARMIEANNETKPRPSAYGRKMVSLLDEAATQLRTAASEGGEEVGEVFAEANRGIDGCAHIGVLYTNLPVGTKLYASSPGQGSPVAWWVTGGITTKTPGAPYGHVFGSYEAAEEWRLKSFNPGNCRTEALYTHPPEVARDAGLVTVPREPTEAQWSGLARDVIMWMNAYDRHSSETLLKHLERSGTEIPDWLRKEADTGPHSLPKGSIAAIIYKAMIADAPQAAISGAAGVG